jgi:hypothetical protein
MPVICFLLALGLEEKGSKWLLILVAILMTWNGYLGIRQQVFQHPFRYWTGTESRSEYLANRVLGYSLYEEANNLVGSEDSLYLINMGNFGYFLRCRWRADFVFEYFRLAKALEKAETGRELRGFFRSQEIKYLMINEVVTFSEMALEKREQRILLEFLRDYSERVSGDQSRSIWRILD